MKLVARIFTVCLVSLFISGSVWAQNKDKQEKIKAQKIAFFTEKIGLTPDEAEAFWPVYNQYWKEKNAIIAARKKDMAFFAQHGDNMKKTELESYAVRYVGYEQALGQLIYDYHEKFCKILPIDKVMKLYLADYEFKTYLLHLIKEGD